jgi:hypothetical protein
MSLEMFILYIMWFIPIASYLLFIPRDKQRNAQISFIFMQSVTWFLGLVIVDLGFIEYPIRFFSEVNKTSFSFEYLAYPVICAFFNIYYPESKGRSIKFVYYASTCFAITGLELIFENYTQLIKYINWTGYISWITLFISLYVSRLYYRWFFKIP